MEKILEKLTPDVINAAAGGGGHHDGHDGPDGPAGRIPGLRLRTESGQADRERERVKSLFCPPIILSFEILQ